MKAMYLLNFASVMFVSFLTLVSNPVLSQDTTHLNVKVENLISLESFCINNDNSLDNQFYYDRQSQSPFSIPQGFTFVVTDIIVYPNCVVSGQNESFFTLVLVEDPRVVRKFTAQFYGTDSKRYALTGGIAYPAGSVPRPRNTSSSTDEVQIQLLGYFIRGTALGPGKPRF